ncbi:hypothetical protein MPF_0718 [Methanohalophilus portucalensis FDF-1]|uniref:Uncharacterized protein n=1 Tax=Methanohalophilus portucalensis FDF-1 TaxID=523843 RepID=A0A1L9C5Y9_9EURY|nr:hypothetical protein MPF_0718 [Methanohalophilus portucalensis FDF-1]
MTVKIQYPLKQGLKLSATYIYLVPITNVKIQYPLKQGLKLRGFEVENRFCIYVKIQYPLKQGLKPVRSGRCGGCRIWSKFNIH